MWQPRHHGRAWQVLRPVVPAGSGLRLGRLALLTGAIVLLLAMLRNITYVPSGWGIEDLLGWTGAKPVQTLTELWAAKLGGRHLGWVPAMYLGVDTALFMPLYGALALACGALAAQAFVWHTGIARHSLWAAVALAIVPGTLLALLVVDLLENLAGLHRLQQPAVAAAALAGAAITGWWMHRAYPVLARQLRIPIRLWWIVLPIAAVALVLGWSLPGTACSSRDSWQWALGCRAHAAKLPLALAVALVPAAMGLWVFFGPHHQATMRATGAAPRWALVSLVVRSRYVLAAVFLVVGLVLVMNQGRDVLYALASRPVDAMGNWHLGPAVLALASIVLAAVSFWTLSYGCWLWARLAGLLRARAMPAAAATAPDLGDKLARDWARGLGATPAVIGALACIVCLRDATAMEYGGITPIWMLVGLSLLFLIGGVAFVWRRTKDASPFKGRYLDTVDLDGLLQQMRAYLLFGILTPAMLPAFTLGAAVACRWLGWAGLPGMALPVMLFLAAFWLTLAGWVSLYERHESVPWLAIVLLWIGVVGFLGWADNHVVARSLELAGLTMPELLLQGTALALVLAIVASRIVWLATRQRLSGLRLSAWIVGTALVLCALTNQIDGRAAKQTAAQRPQQAGGMTRVSTQPDAGSAMPSAAAQALPLALTNWLRQLHAAHANTGQPVPVYFVVAEGGGIRSAYWTARVLTQLDKVLGDENFLQRTFAMSGVSGGSIGLAVYRACRYGETPRSATDVEHCVDALGKTDLLTPLLGAWLFEDGLARMLPQTMCDAPGCGILSRGLWFERAMVDAVPGLSAGLLASQARLAARARQSGLIGHEPYMLLNSTWVETGERSIASELLIDWRLFPSARDQLGQLGARDLALATAAHNSARFPYSNALGAVRQQPAFCEREAWTTRTAAMPATPDHAGAAEICGHLADGGYFDNSGAHAILDVLAVLSRCLRGEEAACPGLEQQMTAGAVPGAQESVRTWLTQWLRPRVLMIRNGVVPNDGDDKIVCAAKGEPTETQLRGDKWLNSRALLLGRPSCAGAFRLYVDAVGPIVTALNSVGTGASARLSAARQRDALRHLPGEGKPPMTRLTMIDLVDDGPLFPLGWHLSSAAMQIMRERGAKPVLDQPESNVPSAWIVR